MIITLSSTYCRVTSLARRLLGYSRQRKICGSAAEHVLKQGVWPMCARNGLAHLLVITCVLTSEALHFNNPLKVDCIQTVECSKTGTDSELAR